MNTARSIEEQILHSGLFKLDDQNKPVGLFQLTPGKKTLSKTKILPQENHQDDEIKLRQIRREMIEDLAIKIKDYLRGPRTYNSLESVVNDFENEFVEFLKSWGFSPEDLAWGKSTYRYY